MKKEKIAKLEGDNIGGKSKAFYVDKIILNQIAMDAKGDDRSDSYIVNKILKKYYINEERIEDY